MVPSVVKDTRADGFMQPFYMTAACVDGHWCTAMRPF